MSTTLLLAPPDLKTSKRYLNPRMEVPLVLAISYVVVVGQKASVLCISLCPNGPQTSFNWFSKV